MSHASAAHRVLLPVSLLCLFACAWPAGGFAAAPAKEQRIVLLSTSDVRGKTSPCGCTIPKGGLGRLVGFADSLRAQYGDVIMLDTGGYFPLEDDRREAAVFLMEMMSKLAYRAVGVGDRDLRFGLSFLRLNGQRNGIPLVSANLVERAGGRTVFPASVIVPQGSAKVGFFSVLDPKADLGPSRDSLQALDPAEAARRTVADLRARGADVVVAFSNLGRMGSEDFATAVPGIDVVVAADNVPLIERGRLVDEALVVYGGEQGQDAGRTLITLDAAHKIVAKTASVFVLDATYADRPEITAMAKAFEARMLARAGARADSTRSASQH